MEGKSEESPPNTEQLAKNIASESSDCQETSARQSSSTTAPSSTPECPENPTKSCERALRDHSARLICPNCNIELITNVHKFCFGCGKNVNELDADLHRKEDHSHLPEPDNFEQIPNNAIEVANDISVTKQEVGAKVDPAVEAISQELQPSAVLENLSHFKEKKTLEERTSPASVGSAEEISNTVEANETEKVKLTVVHKMAVAETVVENVEKSSGLEGDNKHSSFVRNNEGGEAGSVAVDHAGQKTNEDVMPSSELDFSRGNDNINSVFNSDDLEKISSSGTVTNFGEEEEKQVAVAETKIPVAKATGSESQPPPTVVSENTSMEKSETGEEVMTKAGIVNELNNYDAGHTMYSGAEKTSLPVTAVGNELKKRQMVVEETFVTKTKAERVQQFPECSDIFPEHIVTTETAESYQLAKDSMDFDSKRLLPSKELLPSVNINSEYPVQEEHASGNTSDKSSKTVQSEHGQAGTLTKNFDPINNEVETPILKSEKPISQRLNEVFDQLDKIVTNFPTGAEYDANAKAGKETGNDMKVDIQKNVKKNATQGGARANSNKDKGEVPEENETLLAKSKKATSGSLPGESTSPDAADEGSGDGYFYRKAEFEEVQGRRKTRKGNQTSYTSSARTDDKKTLTVIFHAMLSSKFKWDDNKQFVIRGTEPVFDGWNKGGKPVFAQPYNEQLLLQCEVKVPLKHASSKWAYKYVLLDKKNKATYEYLVEFSHWSGIVNRCLVVEKEFAKENQIFHKYDGFVYPKPPAISFERFFPSGFLMNDRRTFFQTLFPRWSGFFADSFDPKIEPTEALLELEWLVEGIYRFWTSTSGYSYRYSIDSGKLRLWELFDEILMPKVLNNLDVLESQTEDANAKVLAVVSSVVIAYVFTKYHVPLKFDRYEILLKCLRLPSDREICSGFIRTINKFDDNSLSSFNKVILQFYREASSNKLLVLNWVPALPLLHFLRRESEPFKDFVCPKNMDSRSWKWWGWDELPYRDIRRHIKERLATYFYQS